MIRAYQETYLNKTQAVLGEAFDYAINNCKIGGDEFIGLFIVSPLSGRIEKGDPSVNAGMSGIEIAASVISDTIGKEYIKEAQPSMSRSPEYWIGWAVAYWQWYSGRRFRELFSAFHFDDLEKMYFTLHEADVTKFVDIAESRIKELFPETNLKRIRTLYGCSQSELANMSGVSLRSIQMYEQRNKDINKAGVSTVYSIALALGCTVEDLLEKSTL